LRPQDAAPGRTPADIGSQVAFVDQVEKTLGQVGGLLSLRSGESHVHILPKAVRIRNL
jgi:hypothetical protein